MRMRIFLVLLLIAYTAAQYEHAATQIGNSKFLTTNDADYLGGAAQLTQPILPVSEFNKEFYSYSAPDAEFGDMQANEQFASALRRNLRVIFIHSPENTALENVALQLAKLASDERTAIYVLSKQADVSELANRLNQIKSNNYNNRPEVHFVKYRTQADAENAQRIIQSQYDSLPGPSSNANTATATVLNFVASVHSTGGAITSLHGTTAPANPYIAPPQTSYLLPDKRV